MVPGYTSLAEKKKKVKTIKTENKHFKVYSMAKMQETRQNNLAVTTSNPKLNSSYSC
jgi:hypothetical protein